MSKFGYLGKWYLGNPFGLSHRGFSLLVVLMLLATYCSLELTTNAAMDNLNLRREEIRQRLAEREVEADRALRLAILDSYPSFPRGERAYNTNLRRGESALTAQDREHRRMMDDVLAHYRPAMLESLKNGVHPTNMRHHMEKVIAGDYYLPAGMTQVAMTAAGTAARGL